MALLMMNCVTVHLKDLPFVRQRPDVVNAGYVHVFNFKSFSDSWSWKKRGDPGHGQHTWVSQLYNNRAKKSLFYMWTMSNSFQFIIPTTREKSHISYHDTSPCDMYCSSSSHNFENLLATKDDLRDRLLAACTTINYQVTTLTSDTGKCFLNTNCGLRSKCTNDIVDNH